MENTRRQQIAADILVATAILALGGVLVVAGRILGGNVAPGGGEGWLRIDPAAFDAAQQLSTDVLLGLVASLVGLAVIAWWLLSAALAISSALLAAAGAHRTALRTGAFAPAFMRRLALALLGISLIGAPAAHAQSLPDPAWHPSQEALAAISPAPARSDSPASLSGSRDPASGTGVASAAPHTRHPPQRSPPPRHPYRRSPPPPPLHRGFRLPSPSIRGCSAVRRRGPRPPRTGSKCGPVTPSGPSSQGTSAPAPPTLRSRMRGPPGTQRTPAGSERTPTSSGPVCSSLPPPDSRNAPAYAPAKDTP